MKLGVNYKRNDNSVKFDAVIPSQEREIKKNVYYSFDFQYCINIQFNGNSYYQYKLGQTFYLIPVLTENKEMIEILKCDKITSFKIEKFTKAKGKVEAFSAILKLNGKLYMTKNIIISDSTKAKEIGLITYLTKKIRDMKFSELNLIEM